MHTRRDCLRLATTAALATVGNIGARAQVGGDLLVFAAASLKTALDAIVAQWSKATGRKVGVSYAASSALARQIEQGAPAQIFLSADLDWMDYLAGKSLIAAETRAKLLGNRLVLVAPAADAQDVVLVAGVDLASRLRGGRLAMANVTSVPAGKYGKAALEKLGAWGPVKDRIAEAENVRSALVLVARGEAPLGIVYRSDAVAEPNVRVVGLFPADSHPPIVYPVAATTGARHPDTLGFLQHLRSPTARAIFEEQGFTVPNAGRS